MCFLVPDQPQSFKPTEKPTIGSSRRKGWCDVIFLSWARASWLAQTLITHHYIFNIWHSTPDWQKWLWSLTLTQICTRCGIMTIWSSNLWARENRTHCSWHFYNSQLRCGFLSMQKHLAILVVQGARSCVTYLCMCEKGEAVCCILRSNCVNLSRSVWPSGF